MKVTDIYQLLRLIIIQTNRICGMIVNHYKYYQGIYW